MASENAFSAPCVPKFDMDYDHWSLIIENLLRSKEYWSVVESRIMETKENIVLNAAEQKLYDEAKLRDFKAKNYLFQVPPLHISFDSNVYLSSSESLPRPSNR
ncbi:hypothetical protein QQ045_002608 [Rhodiola kirilowii]